MKLNHVLVNLSLGVLLLLMLLPDVSTAENDENEITNVPVRIGWQFPAAIQAEITQVLKRTDVLERHGLEPTLVPFSYGTPQVEAALAGELDIFFAGDQPAINLISRGGKWKIVARIYYDRVAIIVPPNSPVEKIEDLKGKSVASPFGSIAHRESILEQRAAGLDPEKDVSNENQDILEISRRVLAGGVESWEGMDAAVVWEPIVSRFELEELARSLTSTRALGVVVVSDDFIDAHPEAVVQFLVALIRSWDFFFHHSLRVMQWYLDDTQLDYTRESLLSAAGFDPNYSAKSLQDVDLGLTEEHIDILEQGAAWGRKEDAVDIPIRQAIDHSLLAKAKKEIATQQFEELRVILPSLSEVPPLERGGGYGLDAIPLGIIFAFMILVALLAVETGLWLGGRRRKVVANEPVGPVATVVGAILAMLAFVIALTFGTASNRFDDRKEALLNDVNAIGTAYLRANLLPEPHRTTVRNLLRDYVQVRVGMVYAYGQPKTLQLTQNRAEALQKSLWSHAETLTGENNHSPIYALFISSLNDVFDLHTQRIVLGAHYRIPGFVWWALILASSVAMLTVGFQFGVGGRRRSLTVNISLAITFALVMLLIIDLDRAGEGLITVNQQPMIDLFQNISKQ